MGKKCVELVAWFDVREFPVFVKRHQLVAYEGATKRIVLQKMLLRPPHQFDQQMIIQ